MSNTFTFTGNSSILSCNIFPEVVLDENSDYSCALLELVTYHSIPNITEANNKVYYFWKTQLTKGTKQPKDGTPQSFEVPPGSYEAHEILDYIKHQFNEIGFSFEYKINKNTFKTTIKCSTLINIHKDQPDDIFRHIFGYSQNQIVLQDAKTESNDIIKISSQDVVRVQCNITSGSFVNGKTSHTIYEFATNKVDVGYKIIEQPKNLIYLPVIQKRLNQIEISLVDQNGAPIDFRGETITCRIHIKKD